MDIQLNIEDKKQRLQQALASNEGMLGSIFSLQRDPHTLIECLVQDGKKLFDKSEEEFESQNLDDETN